MNHSSKFVNCVARSVKIGSEVFIGLFALEDIEKGKELRYNYGICGEEWMKVSSYFNDLFHG